MLEQEDLIFIQDACAVARSMRSMQESCYSKVEITVFSARLAPLIAAIMRHPREPGESRADLAEVQSLRHLLAENVRIQMIPTKYTRLLAEFVLWLVDGDLGKFFDIYLPGVATQGLFSGMNSHQVLDSLFSGEMLLTDGVLFPLRRERVIAYCRVDPLGCRNAVSRVLYRLNKGGLKGTPQGAEILATVMSELALSDKVLGTNHLITLVEKLRHGIFKWIAVPEFMASLRYVDLVFSALLSRNHEIRTEGVGWQSIQSCFHILLLDFWRVSHFDQRGYLKELLDAGKLNHLTGLLIESIKPEDAIYLLKVAETKEQCQALLDMVLTLPISAISHTFASFQVLGALLPPEHHGSLMAIDGKYHRRPALVAIILNKFQLPGDYNDAVVRVHDQLMVAQTNWQLSYQLNCFIVRRLNEDWCITINQLADVKRFLSGEYRQKYWEHKFNLLGQCVELSEGSDMKDGKARVKDGQEIVPRNPERALLVQSGGSASSDENVSPVGCDGVDSGKSGEVCTFFDFVTSGQQAVDSGLSESSYLSGTEERTPSSSAEAHF